MKPRTIGREEPPASAVPEDVAALYAWVDLPGATYQDFSVSRRKLRSQLLSEPPERTNAVEVTPPKHSLLPATSAAATHRCATEAPQAAPIAAPLPPPAEPVWPSFADTVQVPFAGRQEATEEAPVPGPQPEGFSFEASPGQPSTLISVPSASRWAALGTPLSSSGVEAIAPVPTTQLSMPITAIFALTGGSGKTCLLATLGRILSSLGERVVLAETNPQGPLPLYFAAEDFRGESADSPEAEAPVTLASYDLDAAAGDPAREALLFEDLLRGAAGASRLLIDLSERAGWFLRRLAGPELTVLIPVPPNMSSVITLQAVERFFRDFADSEGRPIRPHYLINQFDEEQPVHGDVREFLERRIGDRLLPIVIRNSPAVRQAFARGMTVVDFAPLSPVAEDYRAVVNWLRTVSPLKTPDRPVVRSGRWGRR